MKPIPMPDGGHLGFDRTDDGCIAAIARYAPDGTRVWSASPDFESNDAWVVVRLENGLVIAHSWSCYRVTLDVATGAQVARAFTK